MGPVERLTFPARIVLATMAGALAVLWLVVLVRAPGMTADEVSATWPYLAGMVGAALVTAARALLVRTDRLAWALLAAGLAAWTLGDLLWAVHYNSIASVPVPSLPDLAYYADYPLTLAGLGLLMRSHLHAPGRAFWLDGAIVGLAASAGVAVVSFDRIAASAVGDALETLTTLGYPVLDLVTLCLAVLAVGLTGWRPGRAWSIFVAYLVVAVVADSAYGYAAATGAAVNGFVAVLWPTAALLLAVAAWHDWSATGAVNDGRGIVLVPALGAVTALGVLVHTALAHAPRGQVAVTIAALALAVVLVRSWLSFQENRELLAGSRRDARRDGLTGMRNRRALLSDLEHVLANGTPRRLVFCDLDGFKLYNDSFGHLAGDALLTRLGARMEQAAQDGRAYRLGGDEFCALLPVDGTPGETVRRLSLALSERGEGFAIGASIGLVELPQDADTPSRALQVADGRMYADKTSRRPSARRYARNLLVQILAEREPDLFDHTREVAGYALAVARELGLEGEALDEIARAAELHDVGKVAVPDRVLYGGEDLQAADWQLLRAAPIVGERILASHPALRPVARLVRSTHERWQGDGYPDGLVGEAIPIGARVIAVCDAYDAMLADRPHRAARTPEEALDELRASAGTHFDPAVVAAFAVVLARADRAPAPRMSAAVLH